MRTIATIIAIVILCIFIFSRAEQAVPGELMYPVKIEVNERLYTLHAAVFNSEDEQKVLWNLLRRLDEAMLLVARKTLTRQEAQFLSGRINSLVMLVGELTLNQQEDYIVKTRSQFEIVLRAYNTVLSQLIDDYRSLEGFDVLQETVRGATNRMVFDRETAEEIPALRVADSSKREIDMLLSEVGVLNNTLRERVYEKRYSMSEANQLYALQRLVVGERAVREGKQMLESNILVDAFVLAHRAYRIGYEVDRYISIMSAISPHIIELQTPEQKNISPGFIFGNDE